MSRPQKHVCSTESAVLNELSYITLEEPGFNAWVRFQLCFRERHLEQEAKYLWAYYT